MTTPSAQHIVLASRPKGKVTETDFRLERTEVPKPEPGQVLLRTQYLSLDPYMRWRMERCEILRGCNGPRRGYAGREHRRSRRVPTSRLCQGRHRPGLHGVADP